MNKDKVFILLLLTATIMLGSKALNNYTKRKSTQKKLVKLRNSFSK